MNGAHRPPTQTADRQDAAQPGSHSLEYLWHPSMHDGFNLSSSAATNSDGDTIDVDQLNQPELLSRHFEQSELPIRQTPPVSSALPDVPARDSATIKTIKRPGRRRRYQLTNADWDVHRQLICDLYKSEDLTLKETMEFMQKNHNFVASEKLYKDQFRLWGLFKNLKSSEAASAIKKVNKRQGRKTEILKGSEVIPIDRVKRSYNRLHRQSNRIETQASHSNEDITVRTPESTRSVTSPAGASSGNTSSHHTASCLPFSVNAQGPLDTASMSLDGRGLSANDLTELKNLAATYIEASRFNEAISCLQTVLSGLYTCLNPTQSEMIGTAWSLVCAYTRSGNSKMADTTVNWMSGNYSKEFGLWHPQTLLHYLHAVKILQSFSRYRDAMLLGFRLHKALAENIDPQRIVPIDCSAASEDETPHLPDESAINELFTNTDHNEEAQVNQQLRLLRIWAVARYPPINGILPEFCQQLILNSPLTTHAVDARCILTGSYIAKDDQAAATNECADARKALAAAINDAATSNISYVLSVSRELAALHHQNGDVDGCNKVLNWTADHIICKIRASPRYGHNHQDVRSVVDHLVQVGLECEQQSGYEQGKPWYERAYGLSVKMLGVLHHHTLSLEQALKTRRFDEVEIQPSDVRSPLTGCGMRMPSHT